MTKQAGSSDLKTISWNPFTGCTKVSPACKHCYAETLSEKLNRWGTAGYENTFTFTIHSDRLDKAPSLKRKKPALYFVNSMSDTFHEDVNDETLDRVFKIIRQSERHNFYILTKRSQRMREYFTTREVPDNAWLGVTVEDKEYGLPRLQDLHQIKAKHKHLCCEPLLEDLGNLNLNGIQLIVGGGESGPEARPAQVSWVESLLHQCETQNVHFYWKSWGRYDQQGIPKGNGKSGCLINGKVYKSFPDDMMPGTKTEPKTKTLL
jgi:protein gp37